MSLKRVELKGQTEEGIKILYLEKMLSESAQFRAYKEIQQQQQVQKREESRTQQLEQLRRLRNSQCLAPKNQLMGLIATIFDGGKKSA